MTRMTCDNECTEAGWKEYFVSAGDQELHVSVAPNADLDDRVDAFDHDEQTMIWINGWMVSFEDF